MTQKKNSPSKRQGVAADRDAAIKSVVRRSANFNVPPAPAGDGADPPIIVQGGGSVHMDMPHGFKEQEANASHKKYKHDAGDLVELVIDNGTPIPLNKNSRIEIRYK